MQGSKSKRSVLLALTPALAIAVGWAAAVHAGIRYSAFVGNLIGVIVGSFLIFSAGSIFKLLNKYPVQALSMIIAGISSTLLGPGTEGVQRWLPLGSFYFHLGYILSPFAVFILFSAKKDKRRIVHALGLILTVVFYIQPDAAVATSWNLVFIGALLKDLRQGYTPILLIIALIVMTVTTWTQQVPLVAVPEVESIFTLIAIGGLFEIILAVVAGLFLLSPLFSTLLRRYDENRPFRVAILIYSLLL